MTTKEDTPSVEDYVDLVERYHEQGLSDGIPVVPPTADAVTSMVDASGRRREDVVAELGHRPVRVGDVAEQAVMAGCAPFSMPVVLAAVEGLADPAMRTAERLASTAGLVPITVVCGPIGRQIGMNADVGAFGPGNRANAAIGRAVRLCLRNLAGGTLEGVTLGNGYAYSCAVPDDSESFPFVTLQASLGFGADEDLVVVLWASDPRLVGHLNSGDPEELLLNAAGMLSSLTHFDTVPETGPGRERAVFALGYDFQKILYKAGWDRRRVQEFLASVIGRRAGDARSVGLGDSPFMPADAADDTFVRFYQDPEDIILLRVGGRGAVGQATVARVLGLAARPVAPAPASVEPATEAPDVGLGKYAAQVNGYAERGLNDGWPVTLPTGAAVGAMIAASGRPGDDVLGTFTYSDAPATVRDLAINAVMAGCVPDQMRLLVAAFEMVIPHGGPPSVGAFSPWLVVNGPIRNRLGMTTGSPLLGPGNRVATSIGRALRLGIMNIGRHRPGMLDKAAQGQGWKYTITTLAEDEEGSPWEPLHVTLGFEAQDDVVAFVVGSFGHLETTYTGSDPEALLRILADDLVRADYWLSPTQPPGYFEARRGAFIVLGPDHRRLLVDNGWSRRDVQRFLYEHTGSTLGEIRRLGFDWSGRFPEDWPEDRFVLGLRDPDAVLIVAGGGPGPHSMVTNAMLEDGMRPEHRLVD